MLGAALLFTLSSQATDEKGTAKVNKESSTVHWSGKKITGKTHSGTLGVQSGSISYADGLISSASIVLDMENMLCTDEMDQQSKNSLIGHLQNEDFFNTAEFLTSSFTLSSFTLIKGESYQVTGELTIKGISHEITFPANVKMSDDSIIIDAEVVFDRTKWGIHYGSGSIFDGLGDNIINDDIALTVHIEAAQ